MNSELQNKQLAILEETAAFFNLNNRCVNQYGSCRYWTENRPEGCAVGRLIKDKELCKELDKREYSGVGDNDSFNLLPEELKELGQSFLCRLQRLHDEASFWTETGLSDEGQRRLTLMKERIRLGNFEKKYSL